MEKPHPAPAPASAEAQFARRFKISQASRVIEDVVDLFQADLLAERTKSADLACRLAEVEAQLKNLKAENERLALKDKLTSAPSESGPVS